MKFVLIGLGIIASIALIVFTMGMLAPRDHRLTLSQSYPVPAATLYELVRNFEAYPDWRTGIKSMQKDGELRFIEESGNGKIAYLIIEDQPNTLIISKIDDPKLPFSGSWTFEIKETNGSSELRVTEAGSVPNAFVRFFATYIFSHEKTMRTYLADVQAKFKKTCARS
ncbi:hypothetical protein ACO0LF_29905 [Undibacterium sp. Di27W]|uniref:hypothetical protein n=1 Tax=Undibacterium sp. Di27W TaxID=3413036 RepID=UPI003BF37B20